MMASPEAVTMDRLERSQEHQGPAVVREFRDEDARRWDAFVEATAGGSCFHLTSWKRVLERTFGHQACYVYAERNGEITGVSPVFEVSNWITGRCLISVPLAAYGGICARDEESELVLLDRLLGMAVNKRVEHLELRSRTSNLRPGFHANPMYATFTISLTDKRRADLKRLPKDTRYMIRKGQRAGLNIRHGLDLLNPFYDLFCESMRRFGTPVFPRTLFENMVEEFQGRVDLMLAYAGQRPVYGVFSLMFRDVFLPYYQGTLLDARAMSVTNFLHWELMCFAAERGFGIFDFGRSKRGTGAFSYKANWHIEPEPLSYQVHLVRRKTIPNFSPLNPKFALAGRVWSRLPLWLTRQAGPWVVRWFP